MTDRRWIDVAKQPRILLPDVHCQPEPAELLKYITEGVCWWCRRAGFKVVAAHVSKIHGIDRHQLRDLAGVTYETSICDPEHADHMRKHGAWRNTLANLRSSGITSKGKQKHLSKAARKLKHEIGLRTKPGLLRAGEAGRQAIKDKYTKPRSCTNCGKECPRRTVTRRGERPLGTQPRKTCSPECRKAIRVITARASAQKRVDRRTA